jgi:hypothetical protein
MIVFEHAIEMEGERTLGRRDRFSPRGRPVQLALITRPMVLLLGAIVAAAAYLPGVCDQFGQVPARKTLIGNVGTVRSIAFRQDGAMLSSVGVDCPMSIFDLTGAQSTSLRARGPGPGPIRGL